MKDFPQDFMAYSAERMVTQKDMDQAGPGSFIASHYKAGDFIPLWSTAINDVREERYYGAPYNKQMSHLDWMKGHPKVDRLYVATFKLVSVERVELERLK